MSKGELFLLAIGGLAYYWLFIRKYEFEKVKEKINVCGSCGHEERFHMNDGFGLNSCDKCECDDWRD